MAMAEDDAQLDLLGGLAAPAPAPPTSPRAAVRWAKRELYGRLGWASIDTSLEELISGAKAGVLLVAVEDPTPFRDVSRIDVRHLALPPVDAAVDRHVCALAADARAGRPAVVLAKDESLAAWLVGAALVELGADAAQAAAALGGRGVLGPERFRALAARARSREPGGGPVEPPLVLEPQGSASPEPAIAQPAAIPHPAPELPETAPRRERIVGAVLGAAIGDAMGHPTEFVGSFDAIRARWPPNGVTGYELYWTDGDSRFAPYTDDTQMAECVLRALLFGRDEGADLDGTMRHLAGLFVDWASDPQGGHRSPGNACLAGCRSLASGTAWYEAGGERAGGCGSVMRAYPFGLVFSDDLDRAEAWSVAHSKLTHRDPIALAASAAMAVGTARALRGDEPLTVLGEMVGVACRYSPKTAEMMALALHEAETGVEPEVTLNRLRGWAAHEAIAAVVYLFARHADDPRAAILEGANTPGDSDSLATLAGALVGARTGIGALPSDWVRDVERSSELRALAARV